jgi:hypothetical protein
MIIVPFNIGWVFTIGISSPLAFTIPNGLKIVLSSGQPRRGTELPFILERLVAIVATVSGVKG